GNLAKVSLEHCAIACRADLLVVVIDIVMNELRQVLPVLPVQTGDIASVDVREIGFGHGNLPFGCRATRRAAREAYALLILCNAARPAPPNGFIRDHETYTLVDCSQRDCAERGAYRLQPLRSIVGSGGR